MVAFVIIVELNKESIYYDKDAEKTERFGKEELQKRLYRLLHYCWRKNMPKALLLKP